MFTKDQKKRTTRVPIHSTPSKRSRRQQRQEVDQALSHYLEANSALKNFLRVYGQQLPPEIERFNDRVIVVTDDQLLEHFFRTYGNPFHSLQNLPKNTPVPLRKKIISLVLCFAVVLAQLLSGNVILLPLALGLLSRIQTSSAKAVELPQGIVAPIINNPYGRNQVTSRIPAHPQNYVRECSSMSPFFYHPRITKPQTHPKTIFCIRSVTSPEFTDQTYQAAAQDIVMIFQENKKEHHRLPKIYKILAKFPVKDNIRTKILQSAYDQLHRDYDFIEDEFFQEQNSTTDYPYHFDEVPSSQWMMQAESEDSTQVADLLTLGVPLSPESKLPPADRYIILQVLLENTKANSLGIHSILSSGIDINISDMTYNPLFQAVATEKLEAVNLLLAYGARPLLSGLDVQSAYRQALIIGKRDILIPIIKAVEFPGANQFRIALDQLCSLGIITNENLQQEAYQLFVDLKNFNIKTTDSYGNNFLHHVLIGGMSFENKIRVLKIIEKNAPELVATKNQEGRNPLQNTQLNLRSVNGATLAYSKKTLFTNDHDTLRKILPHLQRLMETYKKTHPEPSWLEQLITSFGQLIALTFFSLLMIIFATRLLKRKPKESFIEKGIYCAITFTQVAKHQYHWQLKILPREQVCERHKAFPVTPLRNIGISDEDLKTSVSYYFNNMLKNNLYYCPEDLTKMKASITSALFSIERKLIVQTEIYLHANSSRSSERKLEKETTKLESIISNYLYFINELDSHKNEKYDLSHIDEQSETTSSILEDVNQLKQEAQRNLQTFKEAFLASSSVFATYYQINESGDFKKIGFDLWRQLKLLASGDLETLKQTTNELVHRRDSYNLEANRFFYDLKAKFEKAVVKLRYEQRNVTGLSKKLLTARPSGRSVIKLSMGTASKTQPLAPNPTPVTKSPPTTALQTFFNHFRSKPYCDSKPIKVSHKTNDELISSIKIHFDVLSEVDNKFKQYHKDQLLRPIYLYAMRFHFLQISHCSFLIKKKNSQTQIAKNDNSDKQVRTLLAHHGYLIEDHNEVVVSVERSLSTFAKALEAKELTFTELPLHERSKKVTQKDDNRSVVELKKTMVDLLILILALKRPIEFFRSEETWRKDALKMLLMEFAECNRCLRRFHFFSWKNGLRDKIEFYYKLEGRLNHLLRAVRHSHEPETPEFTDSDLEILIDQLSEMNQSLNLIAIIESIDNHSHQLGL
jgi:hypothetical protein